MNKHIVKQSHATVQHSQTRDFIWVDKSVTDFGMLNRSYRYRSGPGHCRAWAARLVLGTLQSTLENAHNVLEVVSGTADTIKPTESKPVLNPRLQRRSFSFISKE